jgi:hypothetical protein
MAHLMADQHPSLSLRELKKKPTLKHKKSGILATGGHHMQHCSPFGHVVRDDYSMASRGQEKLE